MSLNDILALKEDYDVEFKAALGRNGKGKLPDDFFETYSAMANTSGGQVFLGIKETKEGIETSGIKVPEPIKKELFDTLNNKNKININILNNEHINILQFDDDYVLEIVIPQATRQQKPVFKGQNPFQGTYIRQYEGDYKCKEEYVKRMLAEQIEDSRDNKVLKNYDFDDIDVSSFYAYRNIFKSHKPDHPFIALNDLEFLKSVGAYKKDRETGDTGLTLAGLLMFGKSSSIEEVLPYYLLDYQERPNAKTELRWIDRVTIDGTWSGNVFDFYRIVIQKLFHNLRVPFKLEKDKRQDDTLIHQAIREAFINALVHADYSQRSSVLIVKRPDMFGFRNPGLMRIPISSAIKGGDSDCRNRTLHKMFMLIGYGERAGSGIPKIYSGWSAQNWTKPLLYEKSEPEQTILELRMINLLNEGIIEELKRLYNDNLDSLTKDELTILITAYVEEGTNHKRLLELLDLHPSDISHLLKKLVDEGLLYSNGVGRGTIYEAKGLSDLAGGVKELAGGVNKTNEGKSVFYMTEEIPHEVQKHIEIIVERISYKQRVKKELMQTVIIDICKEGYFSPELLSVLTGKSKEWIKEHTRELVKTKKLNKLYEIPNHPKQAYTAQQGNE